MSLRVYVGKMVASFQRSLISYFSDMTFEKVAFLICFAIGTIFLFIAIFGPWRYYLLMCVSYIAAFIVTEERER